MLQKTVKYSALRVELL